jgi:hypothetical protein
MEFCRAIILFLCCVVPVVAFAEQPAEMRVVADRLAASVYNGPSMATLAELTDTIGGRLTGSPAYVRSTEWAAAKFRSYGIENVRLEPFTIERGGSAGRRVEQCSLRCRGR